MNKSVSYIISVICLFFYMQIFSSCQKENTTVSAGKDIEWMRVLDESVSGLQNRMQSLVKTEK